MFAAVIVGFHLGGGGVAAFSLNSCFKWVNASGIQCTKWTAFGRCVHGLRVFATGRFGRCLGHFQFVSLLWDEEIISGSQLESDICTEQFIAGAVSSAHPSLPAALQHAARHICCNCSDYVPVADSLHNIGHIQLSPFFILSYFPSYL